MSRKVIEVKDDVHEWLAVQRALTKKSMGQIVDELVREKMV